MTTHFSSISPRVGPSHTLWPTTMPGVLSDLGGPGVHKILSESKKQNYFNSIFLSPAPNLLFFPTSCPHLQRMTQVRIVAGTRYLYLPILLSLTPSHTSLTASFQAIITFLDFYSPNCSPYFVSPFPNPLSLPHPFYNCPDSHHHTSSLKFLKLHMYCPHDILTL